MAYPESVDRFIEKLNKTDTVYVIQDEELILENGVFEGELAHDNVKNESVMVFTEPRLSGERIKNFFLSIPSNAPWKRIIKVFANAPKVYVTYETTGDQVEAEDINRVQESIVNTQKEVERYKATNDQTVSDLDTRLSTVESKKADKTYVDTELLKKADKENTYTKAETDNRIQAIIGAAPEALDTLAEIAEALNNDPDFAATITNMLAQKVDKVDGMGLSEANFTNEEKIKLSTIEEGANKYIHPSTHPASMIVETSEKRFVSDIEKAAWNSAVDHISDGTSHSKTVRFVVGTSTAGWTSADCDYLCDGTADQEEIIQALNALPATGGEVVILDGTYNITASINIPKDNVSIKGNGNATILKRMYNSTSTNSGSTAKGLITLNKKSGCKIQGLQIDGNKATYTASYNYGIYLYSSSNNNTVTGNTCNNNNHGIYLSSSSNNIITGNTCNNNDNYGIYLYSSSNNTITGNTCNNNNHGIHLYSYSSDNTVTGNTCNNNNRGIYLSSSSNNIITGNTCNNNNYYGIYLYSSSSDNTVTGNTCNNNNHGIHLYSSSSDNMVTGNTCNNNDSNGIYLSSSSNNIITGNTCNNNYSRGIYLYSSSNNNTVTGNTCNNNSNGISLYSSSNNTVTGNTCNNNNNNGIYLYLSNNNNTVTGNTCNNNYYGISLYSSSNNTVTGNTCIRGIGTPEDYTTNQHTILLSGASNNYNLISSNNCMGKAPVVGGGTGNTVFNNKWDESSDVGYGGPVTWNQLKGVT